MWSRPATGDAPEAREALATLCKAYWNPNYAFIRRRGHPVEQAQDFFAYVLEGELLAKADSERGRFRAFLRTVCAGWNRTSASDYAAFEVFLFAVVP